MQLYDFRFGDILLETTLTKILTFDKKEKQESKDFNFLISTINLMEESPYEESNEDEYNNLDIFLSKIKSETLSGKVTLAKFNKFLNKEAINNNSSLKYIFDLMEESTYSDLNYQLLSRIASHASNKRVDFTSLLIYGNLKNLIIQSKEILHSDKDKLIDIMNKFFLLCIFLKWKNDGYINSAIVDNVSKHHVRNRYINTCKTSVYNIYNCFNDLEKINITDSMPELNRELSMINSSKNSSIIFYQRFSFKMDIYNKYKKSYERIRDICTFGNSFRYNNVLTSDLNLIKNILSLSVFNIEIDTSAGYSYGINLDGKINLKLNFSNQITRESSFRAFNDYGIFTNGFDNFTKLLSVPSDNLNAVVFLYNRFGYGVESQVYNINHNNPIFNIKTVYDCRNNLTYELSIKELLSFNISQFTRGSGNHLNCISKMIAKVIDTLIFVKDTSSLGVSALHFKQSYFMPFIFFYLDMQNLFCIYSSYDHSFLSKRLFDTIDSEENIISSWINIIKSIRNISNVKIDRYVDARLEDLCKVYREYLSELDFDIDKSILDTKYIFLVHLNEFILNVISHINEVYKHSEEENIYFLDDLFYLDKALNRFNNVNIPEGNV